MDVRALRRVAGAPLLYDIMAGDVPGQDNPMVLMMSVGDTWIGFLLVMLVLVRVSHAVKI